MGWEIGGNAFPRLRACWLLISEGPGLLSGSSVWGGWKRKAHGKVRRKDGGNMGREENLIRFDCRVFGLMG